MRLAGGVTYSGVASRSAGGATSTQHSTAPDSVCQAGGACPPRARARHPRAVPPSPWPSPSPAPTRLRARVRTRAYAPASIFLIDRDRKTKAKQIRINGYLPLTADH